MSHAVMEQTQTVQDSRVFWPGTGGFEQGFQSGLCVPGPLVQLGQKQGKIRLAGKFSDGFAAQSPGVLFSAGLKQQMDTEEKAAFVVRVCGGNGFQIGQGPGRILAAFVLQQGQLEQRVGGNGLPAGQGLQDLRRVIRKTLRDEQTGRLTENRPD